MTEHCFFSPTTGAHWVAIDTPSAEISSTYPGDVIEVPQPPVDGKAYRGTLTGSVFSWVAVHPAPPVSLDVDAERDRRIGAGFVFQGAIYQTRPEDRENMMGASTAALAAMVAGAQAGDFRWHGEDDDFEWIDGANDKHPMDAQTMFNFGKTAMSHKQAHIFAARAIKDMSPIPADFATNEAYWPAVANA